MGLPKEIQIGGQVIKTQICEELGGKLGSCCCYNGYIKIATNVDGCTQTESSMLNTYIHECTHVILDTMGRGDLSQDETFVSTFASFATEGIVSILEQLKERYTWKPSGEQMDALNDFISSRDIKYDVLSELWKDLNKLRGK